MRITAQLINVADGYHLWSERYDRQLTDIFAIQDEISESIVRALQLTLSQAEKRSFGARPKASLEAYEYYLRGRHYLNKSTREDIEFAIQMFRQAADSDPEYALAYSGQSECHAILYHWYGRRDVDLTEAERVSLRAVTLAPELAEAHAAHGLVLSLQGRHDRASASFERAIELNPNLFETYYYYARDRTILGNWPRAAELFERAAEVRPEDYQALLLLPQVRRSLDQPKEALEASREGLARARRHVALHPEDGRAYALGAGALLALGERDEAIAWIERALELQPENTIQMYNAACVYSRAGELDRALEYLERLLGMGFGVREWFENDSDLDNVRADPRFQKLMDETDWGARESG